MDSGAARSVCPRSFGGQFPLVPLPEGKSTGFRTATNKRVPTLGSRTVHGKHGNGSEASMKYSVADVSMALDSVSQIADTGAHIIFEKDGGRIITAGGQVIPIERRNDTYVRRIWVRNTDMEEKGSGFTRQRK